MNKRLASDSAVHPPDVLKVQGSFLNTLLCLIFLDEGHNSQK